MASKVTFISGQSIEVPGHGWLKRGIEIVRECDEEILESPALFQKFTDHYYEVADLTVQAAIWKWVAAHPTPAPVGPLVRDRDDPNRVRDRAIEEARGQREPQPAVSTPSYHNGNGNGNHNGNGNGNGYQKQQYNWNRGGGAPDQRQSGGGNRDGNPYRPRTGKELFGWAKDREAEGRDGFFKAVSKYAKDQFRAWKFDMLNDEQAMQVLEVAEQWIAESN